MDKMREKIKDIIEESISVKKDVMESRLDAIEKAASAVITTLKAGGKVVLFGNGGSAADSQHIAAELVGRFAKERRALPAIALSTNTSTLTAIGNDYSYAQTFARQLDALAEKKDIVIGISTSGKSENVVEAVKLANSKGIMTIALTGGDGGELAKAAKISIIIPSKVTPRIQEAHITIGHIICEMVEDELF